MNITAYEPNTLHDKASRLVKILYQNEILPLRSEAERDEDLFPSEEFQRLRQQVHALFSIERTNITPLMARILYSIAYYHRPRRIAVLGSYMANALVWLAAPGAGPQPVYQAESVVGLDINRAANRRARQNMLALDCTPVVEILDADAYEWTEKASSPVDLLFLDLKQGYLSSLKNMYKRLRPGALVLAHDILNEKFSVDLKPYLEYVNDRRFFYKSTLLCVDSCGLEVTRIGCAESTTVLHSGGKIGTLKSD